MLPKAHLTSNSRMSGSRLVVTPSCLSGSWRSFLYISSVYSCHLFLISSASARPLPFLSFIVSVFAWNFSKFLKEISSLSHSVVFLYFFVLITEEGFLISPCYSLELCIQMDIPSFSSLPLASLLFSAIVRHLQATILTFCVSFSWGWSWSLLLVQCHEPLSIVLQASCLSDPTHSIYLSLSMYNHKGFDFGHTWMVSWFSQLSSI